VLREGHAAPDVAVIAATPTKLSLSYRDAFSHPLPRARSKYSLAPVLVIVDVRPDTEGLPVAAYQSIESFNLATAAGASGSSAANGGAASAADVAAVRTFAHVSSEVGAYEAEEVSAPAAAAMAGGADDGVGSRRRVATQQLRAFSPLHPCYRPFPRVRQVGVEHLLRDINDPSVSTLAGEARHKLVREPRASNSSSSVANCPGWRRAACCFKMHGVS
jgi:hypothetical protein